MDQEIIQNDSSFWALFELMGHTKVVGYATEWEFGQFKFFRIDCLDPQGNIFYQRALSPASIFAINFVTKETAIELAKRSRIHSYVPFDLAGLLLQNNYGIDDDYDPDDDEDYSSDDDDEDDGEPDTEN